MINVHCPLTETSSSNIPHSFLTLSHAILSSLLVIANSLLSSFSSLFCTVIFDLVRKFNVITKYKQDETTDPSDFGGVCNQQRQTSKDGN